MEVKLSELKDLIKPKQLYIKAEKQNINTVSDFLLVLKISDILEDKKEFIIKKLAIFYRNNKEKCLTHLLKNKNDFKSSTTLIIMLIHFHKINEENLLYTYKLCANLDLIKGDEGEEKFLYYFIMNYNKLICDISQEYIKKYYCSNKERKLLIKIKSIVEFFTIINGPLLEIYQGKTPNIEDIHRVCPTILNIPLNETSLCDHLEVCVKNIGPKLIETCIEYEHEDFLSPIFKDYSFDTGFNIFNTFIEFFCFKVQTNDQNIINKKFSKIIMAFDKIVNICQYINCIVDDYDAYEDKEIEPSYFSEVHKRALLISFLLKNSKNKEDFHNCLEKYFDIDRESESYINKLKFYLDKAKHNEPEFKNETIKKEKFLL
jgi:hypothetical protein